MNFFKIEVLLVVAALEALPEEKINSKFLVVEHDNIFKLPSQELSIDKTSKDIAQDLLRKYTGITRDWAILLPLGIVDEIDRLPDERIIGIPYGVFIPEPTRIREANSRWKTYEELVKLGKNLYSDTLKLIQEAVWRPL
jgi:hypothetical protein